MSASAFDGAFAESLWNPGKMQGFSEDVRLRRHTQRIFKGALGIERGYGWKKKN